MSDGALAMGRPKSGAKAKKISEDGERVAVIHLKGSADYANWLDEFHRQTHIPKATLFRLGIAEIAKQHGFRPPPEI